MQRMPGRWAKVGMAGVLALSSLSASRASAESFDVSLFYSGDLQGRLLPVPSEEPNGPLGGIARMAAVCKAWGVERPSHVLVDVGNATVVSHKQADAVNRVLFDAFDAMGYAVVNCGDNEAALSLDRLAALARGRRLQMISANLLNAQDNQCVFPAHHVVRVGDRRVAFIGLLRPDTARLTVGKGLRIGDPVEALRSSLAALEGQADLVVVLAYLPPRDLYSLARKVPGIHVFLGGRAGASSAAYELAGQTLIAYLGDEGATLGRLDGPSFPRLDPQRPVSPPFALGRIAILDKAVPDDPRMSPILADLQAALAGEAPPGSDWDIKMPRTSSHVGSEVCKLCHQKPYYTWQATRHAGAYATLVQQDASAGPRRPFVPFARDPGCLRCHVTGYGLPGGYDPEKALPGGDAPEAVGQPKQFQLVGVGCETCHGGSRRHLGVAIRAGLFDVAKAPQLRVRDAARTCLRCHRPSRPCLEPGKADPFDADDYLRKIQHW